MEIITILSVIAIIYLFINDYKISKNVRGLKTLVKVIYKEKYKNDNEIKKPVFPKRSDMQPPPSPEKIDCINSYKLPNIWYSQDSFDEYIKEYYSKEAIDFLEETAKSLNEELKKNNNKKLG